jgi:hypothetical protein
MQPPRKKVVPLALAALATGGTLPAAAGGAKPAGEGCVAPDVVGVNLAMARRALSSSGCGVTVRQLPGHGSFVTPSGPDGRQIVARQSPGGGGRTSSVTVFLEPLCAQPAQPGPKHAGAEQRRGPTELVAGLYVEGGPLQTSPHCRNALPQGGTLTVSSSAGEIVASRRVRDGHFAIFPLAPGSYVLAGSLSRAGGRLDVPPTGFTIAARRTTHVNTVAVLP